MTHLARFCAGAGIFGVLLVLVPVDGHAMSIGFAPASTTVSLGAVFDVDIVVSDLGEDIVSAYDLDVAYDATLLSVAGVTFGTLLNGGDLLNSFQFQLVDFPAAGLIDLAELSLLFDDDLAALQGDSVLLATLSFNTLAAGSGELTLVPDPVFGVDVKGREALVLPLDVGAGAVTVAAAAVPEPSSWFLLVTGLVLAIVSARMFRITTTGLGERRRPVWIVGLALVLSGFAASTATAAVCDCDADGDVDRNDIGIIFSARNAPASGPQDPRDADGDGRVTVNDGRACTLRCTLPSCAVPAANAAPNATAGPDQNVAVGALVTLDGSASHDPDNGPHPLAFQWTFASVPAGSSLVDTGINNAASAAPNFTPDVAGTYVLNLQVSDGALTDTDSVEVAAAFANVAPNADAGPDQNATVGALVTLDGSASHDPDAGPDLLTFVWSFLSVPPGSSLTSADIGNATSAAPSFTPDIPGTYVIDLAVGDGALEDHDATQVVAAAANVAPNAHAGPDQNVVVGALVTLDGSGSHDPDNGPSVATFSWSFFSVPASSGLTNADLNAATSAAPTFTPDAAGAYVVNLGVSDGDLTDSDQVMIIAAVPNVAPNADAGPDQSVRTGRFVALDGRASTDPDGGPDALTFSWTFVSAPPGSSLTNGSLSGADTSAPSFTPDVDGTYVLSLEVNDGDLTDSDQVMVIAGNQAPVALGDAYSVDEDGTLTVNAGTGVLANDSDADGDPLGALLGVDVIDGTLTLNGDGSFTYAPNPDFDGTDTFTYRANDGDADSNAATVTTTVNPLNDPPVANAGPDQSVTVGAEVQVTSAGSSDPDGDSLSYQWTMTARPDGSAATLSNPLAVNPSFIADQPGVYVVDLVVNDGAVDSAADSATVVSLQTTPAGPTVRLCAFSSGEGGEGGGSGTGDEGECPSQSFGLTRGIVVGEVDEASVSVTLNGVLLPDGVSVGDETGDGPIFQAGRSGRSVEGTINIPQIDGAHRYTLVATDAQGRQGSATVTFIRDTVEPLVTITAPPPAPVVNTLTTTITGTVDDPTATVRQDFFGESIPVTDGAFTITLPLDHEGDNFFTISARDPAGNFGSASLDVIRDTTPPEVTIATPTEGSAVATPSLTMAGTITDLHPGSATVSVNGGAPVPLPQGSGSYSTSVNLNEGTNTIQVDATDAAGNVGSLTRSVVLDVTPPVVQLTAPAAGASLTGVVSITAEASDTLSGVARVEFLVDGVLQATRFAPPWTVELDTIAVPAGSHQLTARAVDGAGNEAETSVSVDVQPQIHIAMTAPTDGSTVTQSPILVRGTVTDNLPEVGITVNGFIAHTQGGQFAVEGVEVAPGSTTLTATATDGAGLIVTASATVTVPPGPPSPPVTLRADFSSSLAPAGVAFEVETFTPHPIVSYQLDFEGNGTVDFTSSTFAGVSHTYPIAGLYVPTLTVRDAQGTTFMATTVVNLVNQVTIDTLVQRKWTRMKAALVDSDIATAVEAIAVTERDGYGELFTALASQFSQIDLILRDISFVSIAGDRAEYQLIRVDDGVRLSYFVLWVQDTDGIWRLKFF